MVVKIEGLVILITGGARRVGREIALRMAKRGAKLIVHYHRSQQEAKSLQRKIVSEGGECLILKADLKKSSEVIRLAHTAWAWKKKVDVLINNAAVFYPSPLGKFKEGEWDEIFNINTRAPFILSAILGEKMKRRGQGSIIQIADASGLKPYPHYVAYCASKAALLSLTQGIAKSLAPEIRVNAILPGPVLLPKDYAAHQRKKILEKIPLKRLGSPENVTQAVEFLIECDYVTGALIPVEGGYLL